jgi:hypothetical protein
VRSFRPMARISSPRIASARAGAGLRYLTQPRDAMSIATVLRDNRGTINPKIRHARDRKTACESETASRTPVSFSFRTRKFSIKTRANFPLQRGREDSNPRLLVLETGSLRWFAALISQIASLWDTLRDNGTTRPPVAPIHSGPPQILVTIRHSPAGSARELGYCARITRDAAKSERSCGQFHHEGGSARQAVVLPTRCATRIPGQAPQW